MIFSTTFILILLTRSLQSEFKTSRNIEISNKCEFPIWIGFHGKSYETGKFITENIPNNGGWYIDIDETSTLNVPNIESVIIWARTNCGYDPDYSDSFEPFRCDTGECWAEFNGYGKDGSCCGYDVNDNYICAGPKAPASLAEFTFGNNENANDFYDVSLVDGYAIPVSIEPIAGTFNKDDTINPDENTCGKAEINTFNSKSKCPPMLQIDGTSTRNESIDYDFSTLTYCRSICKSVDDPEQTDDILKEWKNENDASNVLNEWYSDDISSAHKDKSLLDLLCCQCGEGGGGCYDDDKSCNYGCSPFSENDDLDARMCPNNGLPTKESDDTDASMPVWPLIKDPSGQYINPAFIYRDTSPNAYSWQFDDFVATFQCNNADYKITFC